MMYENLQKQWLLVEDGPGASEALPSGDGRGEGQGVSGMALITLLNVLRRHARMITVAALVVSLLTFFVCKRITPLYEATTTLEVNPDGASDLIGPDKARASWNDTDQFIGTQLRVIQEDSVLRPVVLEHDLPFNAEANPEAPIVLKGLKVLRPPNTYLIQIIYRSADSTLAAAVANGVAESYLHHVFRTRLDERKSQSRFMEQQLDEVQAAMERSARAVSQFEAKLGVVDSQDKTNIVSARLLQLSTEYTAAQADRIKKEADYRGLETGSLSAAQQSDQGENLKQLQSNLNQAQQRFVEVREHFGTSHPEYVKQSAIIAGLQTQLEQAKAMVGQRARVAYENAQTREQILQQSLGAEKAAFDRLNATSYQYQGLKIEAEGNRKLYDDLERRIKEATINGSFQNGTTHISDYARATTRAVFPRTGLTVGLSFAFTLLLGMAFALAVEMADDTIRSSEQIEASFHADLLGAIPQCDLSTDTSPLGPMSSLNGPQLGTYGGKIGVASVVHSTSRRQAERRHLYDEAVRMLWSSLQIAGSQQSIRSVLVTSAMPEEGKSTLITRLACVHAGHDRRTLLIDADLRRPSIHRLLRLPLSPGLADALRGEMSWRDLVVSSPIHPLLDILPAGAASLQSLDDITRSLPLILADAASDYDLVLVDGPPLLAFADPLHMASAADGVIVVVCADKTSRRAVASMLQILKRVRANLLGIALNRVVRSSSGASYSYRDYNDHKEAA